MPSDINIDNVLALTTYKKHVVRDGAIKCLKNVNNPKAEEKLIEIITTSTDQYQLTYANATIRAIGTSKSIPHLLKLVANKKQDVAASALGAILKLSDKSHLPLFIDNLENGKLKYLGLEGVIKYGDKNIVPYVEKRVKELLLKSGPFNFIFQGTTPN
jgi:HEAT repeat protein